MNNDEGAEEEGSSYYGEESEYDEEYESEEEEAEAERKPKVGGWTDNGDAAVGEPAELKEKKEFDPRTDKMFDIRSDDNYLMESLANFKPPEISADKSGLSLLSKHLGESQFMGQPDKAVIAGLKLRNMVENTPEDLEEIRMLQDPNFRPLSPHAQEASQVKNLTQRGLKEGAELEATPGEPDRKSATLTKPEEAIPGSNPGSGGAANEKLKSSSQFQRDSESEMFMRETNPQKLTGGPAEELQKQMRPPSSTPHGRPPQPPGARRGLTGTRTELAAPFRGTNASLLDELEEEEANGRGPSSRLGSAGQMRQSQGSG